MKHRQEQQKYATSVFKSLGIYPYDANAISDYVFLSTYKTTDVENNKSTGLTLVESLEVYFELFIQNYTRKMLLFLTALISRNAAILFFPLYCLARVSVHLSFALK